jgi:hypothetical protein
VAVGAVGRDGGRSSTLAMHWDGDAWTTVPTPTPPGAFAGFLEGVSCRADDACVAVGTTAPDLGDRAGRSEPMALRWDGSTWSLIERPALSRPSQGASFADISCPSATSCIAVGTRYDVSSASRPLVERWNGTRWVPQLTSLPAGATQGHLAGVSCSADAACTAVGAWVDAAGQVRGLIQRRTGDLWVNQPGPVPAGLDGIVVLKDVSCPATSACTAVGHYETGGIEATHTLAQRWDGARWTVDPTPHPEGARRAYLEDVSCPSPATCRAVGDVVDQAHTHATLAQHTG